MTKDAEWITVRVTPGARRDQVLTASGGPPGNFTVVDVLAQNSGTLPLTPQPADFRLVDDHDAEDALTEARDVLVATEPLAISDWSERWKQALTAQRVGRLTVTPPWLATGLDPETTIVIEPGMAFGTGDHATTRSVVQLLQDVVRSGDSVADLGAGSAVLAISATGLRTESPSWKATQRCCCRSLLRCASLRRTSSRRC